MLGYMGSPAGPTLHHLGCGQCLAQQAITEPAGDTTGVSLGADPFNQFSVSEFTGQALQYTHVADQFARLVEGKPLQEKAEDWWSENWGWVVAGAGVLWFSTVGIQAIPQWMTALRR